MAGFGALWFYDYFLTLSDEVRFPCLTQSPVPDISGSDRVHLVWEILVESVIVSGFEPQRDYVDGAPVFVLFILVSSLLPPDSASCTKRNTEQVLATMVPAMVVCRSVDPLPSVAPSQLLNSLLEPRVHKDGE